MNNPTRVAVIHRPYSHQLGRIVVVSRLGLERNEQGEFMSGVANQTVVRLRDFRVRDVGSEVAHAASSLADQLVDGLQGWTSKARSAAKTTDGFVRSSPWQAVGAVAVAGVAAGMLVSHRMRRARRRAANDLETTSEVLGG